MSVDIMSAVFKAKIDDLEYMKDGQKRKAKASTVKLVLLAIADHANDDGEAYPGFTKLEGKTALSRQGLIDTLDALKFNGILSVEDERSKLKTNKYTIIVKALSEAAKVIPAPEIAPTLSSDLTSENNDQSSHLTSTSQATLPALVKPLDHNHHLTIIKPSIKKTSAEKPNFKNLSPIDYLRIPEIRAFIDATGWEPGSFVVELVYDAMKAGIDHGKLKDAFTAWVARGYNPRNVAGYLGWARDGIPDAKTGKPAAEQKNPYAYMENFVPEDMSNAVPPPPEQAARIRAMFNRT